MRNRLKNTGAPFSQKTTWRSRWFNTLVVLISIFTMASLVEAAEGKRIAFVVGINTYKNFSNDHQLQNAVNDAREISRTLKHIGFEVIERFNVTVSDFDKQWQAVLETITSEDTLVFFFSGHGVEVDEENLLLPSDIPYYQFGRHKEFRRRAISVSELMKDLRIGDRQHPKVTVMILDACRENPTIPSEYRTKGVMPPGGLVKVPKTRGTFMLYAAEPGKVSLERLGPSDKHPNSVYTRSLLPLLEQANMPIQDLAIKLKERVYTLTNDVGYEQLPEYTDGLIGQFCLAGCAAKDESLTVGSQESSRDTLPKMITGKDGAPMVLIPAGTFVMGLPDGEGDKDEHPIHQVRLDGFYIDKFEVTVARYAKFMRSTNRPKPAYWEWVDSRKHGKLPVVGVDWHDATTYCEWAEKRLPTEAEWEKAARGTDERRYPWGNEQATARLANFEIVADQSNLSNERLAPVDSHEAGNSPYGLHHMAGNVWEWTADWYDAIYYSKSPDQNPTGPIGPSSSGFRVLRGGSYGNGADMIRSTYRRGEASTMQGHPIGFRCAQNGPPRLEQQGSKLAIRKYILHPFKEGKPLGVNIVVNNTSSKTLTVMTYVVTSLEDSPKDKQEELRIENKLHVLLDRAIKGMESRSSEIPPSPPSFFHTVQLPALNANESKRFHSGEMRFYFLGALVHQDGTMAYCYFTSADRVIRLCQRQS